MLAHPRLHFAPRHGPPAGLAHPVRARGVPPRQHDDDSRVPSPPPPPAAAAAAAAAAQPLPALMAAIPLLLQVLNAKVELTELIATEFGIRVPFRPREIGELEEDVELAVKAKEKRLHPS